jgi:hypothetical protein
MLAILRQGGFERKTILASFPLAVGGPTDWHPQAHSAILR